MERFSFILVTAGILSFVFAFVVMAVLPWATYKDDPILTVAQVAEDIPYEFFQLAAEYSGPFQKHFGEPNTESFAKALQIGHDVYVAEACWHCHSQFIRPVSNEDARWGPVSYPQEYQNELQMPVMFGTRRIGPDLSRESAIRSNGWHVAHFWRPRDIVPDSVMPNYPWLFEAKGIPNEKGLALIAYVQWLGSWIDRDVKKLGLDPEKEAMAMKLNRSRATESEPTAAPAQADVLPQAAPADAAAPAAAPAKKAEEESYE